MNDDSRRFAWSRMRLAALIVAMAGCSDTAPPLTPTPSAPIPVQISGVVVDVLEKRIEGATVEAIAADGARFSTTSGADGTFDFAALVPQTSNFTLTANKPDYLAATRTLPPPLSTRNMRSVILTLPPAAPWSLAGTYSVEFVAAQSCTTLPDFARRRRYGGVVTQQPGSPNVALTVDRKFEGGRDLVFGRVSGDALFFWISYQFDVASDELPWVELLGGGGFISFFGTASADRSADGVRATFNGKIEACEPVPGAATCVNGVNACTSSMHEIILTPEPQAR